MALASAPSARAVDFGSRFSLHGYGELQFRMLAADYQPENANLAQWMNVLNLEFEGDLAPDGIGPFDTLSVFSRVLVRYDCVYNGCGMLPTWRYTGDRATRAPRNFTTGRTNPFNGTLLIPGESPERIERDNELVDFFVIPPFDSLRELGATNLDATFAPIADARFAIKDVDASIGNGVFPLGPWHPSTKIDPTGSLAIVPNTTSALPLRPQVPDTGAGFEPHGLFIPSQSFTAGHADLGDFEQNYNQNELAWHHTSSQDERELKEFYFDAEMLDGRLWLRVGKQTIVWGKTELFRTTDQFNPQTLALSSLPSLEESRIALWSARATYSFYDVGPLEDVRLEVAAEPRRLRAARARPLRSALHDLAGVREDLRALEPRLRRHRPRRRATSRVVLGVAARASSSARAWSSAGTASRSRSPTSGATTTRRPSTPSTSTGATSTPRRGARST